jgi:hypothetical protein
VSPVDIRAELSFQKKKKKTRKIGTEENQL